MSLDRFRKDAVTQIEFWEFVGHVIVGVAVWQGIGYAVGGNSAAQGASYYLLKKVPDGMRLHGFIMLTLATLLLVAIHRLKWTAFNRWVFRVFTFYGLLIGCTFFESWYITKQVTWGGPGWWFAIAALAQGMVLYPPAREISLAGEASKGDAT